MRKIENMPALPGVNKTLGVENATNTYHIFDSVSEFAAAMDSIPFFRVDRAWQGNMNHTQTLDACRNGNMAGVAIADKMLAKLEGQFNFETQVWRNVFDVQGGVPCVPAYLAGHPLNMRRRQRVMSDVGPITIVCDLASSGGISAEQVQQRGCAVLALVRILSAVRPVELWACCELDCGNYSKKAGATLIRLDTAPLDLARVAHVLSHQSVSRGLCYSYGKKAFDSDLVWAYGDVSNGIKAQREHGAESFKRVLNPASGDCLFIAPAFLKDKLLSEPVKWLKDMIARYGGMDVDLAA